MSSKKWSSPVICKSGGLGRQTPINAKGTSFFIYEWTGSGPDNLHVHYGDDEAWYVLEGALTFRFADGAVVAGAGTTVFVPAGTPHTYYEPKGTARYLIILTPNLNSLIEELAKADKKKYREVYPKYQSEILDL